MPIHYIGRESYFHGKSIYEIARNLRNFGEGRYVYRVSFSKRYKEPSFYKLRRVVPDMNAKGYCRGTATGEKIFRGVNYGLCNIDAGQKLDWRLIPKDEEQKWIDAFKEYEQKPIHKPVIPSIYKVPCLLEMVLSEEKTVYEIPFDREEATKLKVKIKTGKFNKAVLADG